MEVVAALLGVAMSRFWRRGGPTEPGPRIEPEGREVFKPLQPGSKTPTQRKRDRQSQPRPSTTTKRCSKCGTVKAIYLFHRRANSPDGHKPHCAACVANYDADRQPRNYSKEARG